MEALERIEGGPQLCARIGTPSLATQELAVQEFSPCLVKGTTN
jgi:hypothetical protein